MPRKLTALLLIALGSSGLGCGATRRAAPTAAEDTIDAAVRHALVAQYERNRRAFLAKDVPAIMALRTADFHAVTPDGRTHDRKAMEEYITGLLAGIRKWHSQEFTIDSIRVTGTEADAVVSQHLDRDALRPDGKVHRVETWVTQHEVWVRTPEGWKMRRVDRLRDQRRLVDGKPQ